MNSDESVALCSHIGPILAKNLSKLIVDGYDDHAHFLGEERASANAELVVRGKFQAELDFVKIGDLLQIFESGDQYWKGLIKLDFDLLFLKHFSLLALFLGTGLRFDFFCPAKCPCIFFLCQIILFKAKGPWLRGRSCFLDLFGPSLGGISCNGSAFRALGCLHTGLTCAHFC